MSGKVCAVALLCLAAASASAEQFKTFGAWRVHYIAFNASLLSPEVARRHGIVRGRNKGVVNISVVGASGHAERIGAEGAVSGRFLNLLNQSTALEFREVEDAGTVYYLAAFDFENAETLRFQIELKLPGHGAATLRFQQPLYYPAD